jgi:3-hydroxyisobutyrate dehydrogenase
MQESVAPRVAVLGLGNLGAVVARKAALAGLHVTAWDRAPERRRSPDQRVDVASTPVEAIREADAVVTMLFDADAVLGVMGDLGACNGMKPGSTWLQMSTIGVEGTERAISLAARNPGIAFIDAPISGSKYAAESGQLVVFASGDRDRASIAVQPFLNAIAGKVHWFAQAGQGTRIGLLFNAWIGILIENIAEVTILGHALGIEPRLFVELVSDGSLVPPWALAKFQKIVENRTAEVEVPLRLAQKNALLALIAAGAERPRLPVLDLIASSWARMVPAFGDSDISALYLSR